MLDVLQEKHPIVYQFIYGEASDAIATINKDMSDLYLDLSFDVVWVFEKGFGKLRVIKNEETWVISQFKRIDVEMKSMTKEIPMNDKIRQRLLARFVSSSVDGGIQLGLLEYIENEVDKYASFKAKRQPASQMTKNLLFVLIRLVGEMYKSSETRLANRKPELIGE